jgi:hypothetical protein
MHRRTIDAGQQVGDHGSAVLPTLQLVIEYLHGASGLSDHLIFRRRRQRRVVPVWDWQKRQASDASVPHLIGYHLQRLLECSQIR